MRVEPQDEISALLRKDIRVCSLSLLSLTWEDRLRGQLSMNQEERSH